MLHIDGAIIVEGKYDKIKLSRIVDCPIIVTGGFSIFRSEETKTLLRWYARNGGIIILTDSDSAGFKIRGYIKGIVKTGIVKNAYIPDVFGKERRKTLPSAEGKIGVEGMSEKDIINALRSAGVVANEMSDYQNRRRITRLDLYEVGLFGAPDSSQKRSALLKHLDLPERLSTSGLLEVVNCSMDYDHFIKIVETL